HIYICVAGRLDSHRYLRRPTPFLTDQGSPGWAPLSVEGLGQELDGRQFSHVRAIVKNERGPLCQGPRQALTTHGLVTSACCHEMRPRARGWMAPPVSVLEE